MMADVIPFVKRKHTVNVETGKSDGFTCMVCGHWLYESETEWGDYYICRPKRFGNMHGTEPLRFCPHCGALVLTPAEWVDLHPEDAGKPLFEIERRYYERGGE